MTGVSALICVHNGEPHLAEAIESVLGQDPQASEVIVLDDGSSDGSVEVARRFGDRIRLERVHDRGAGEARNAAAALSSGDVLAFLDQDDLWTPGRLGPMLAALGPGVDAVFGHADEFVSPEVPSEVAATIRPPLTGAPAYVTGGMVIRRAAFDRVGGFGAEWVAAEWFEWFVRARDLGLEMRLIDDVVLRRRIHVANRTLRMGAERTEMAVALKRSLDRRRR